ncbi:t(6)A37 threonylcarbamoyladenosine biosynthesis protein [Thiorhodovibrio winogradskyi]|uniref:tRNA threonylcarbamoyladenosine biosynthesis protein TsaB n=1 Tax=Thiorhodovibrio winogradskyi TaxID=77007 RepID=A0ABZ0SEN7_9GAMM|nr:tRNA (adenosine(37)-N6)-threonylcarbamoyltransferase complex dimerization subunit type 1 TsaB [Thiorhodovibrio winogradskyi]
MKILALETSGVFCSVALLRDGELLSQHEEAARRHGERLLPMMEQLLEQGSLGLGDLDAIAFGCGPGSFTGVRIAAAVAQGVAFGAGVPVVGISTLAALAHAGWRSQGHTRIIAAIDARIDELYWGFFNVQGRGLVSALQPECVSVAEKVTVPFEPAERVPRLGVGNGWSLYRDLLIARTGLEKASIDASLTCTAADIAELAVNVVTAGQAMPPELGLPVYLRDQVAIKRTAVFMPLASTVH